MAVVSIRCHECDTVKREEHIEMRGDGNNICDECKKGESAKRVEEAKAEGDRSEEEEEAQEEPEDPEEKTTEEEESKDDGSKFTEQDALSW